MISDIPFAELQSLLNRIAHKDDKALKVVYLHYQTSVYAFVKNRVDGDHLVDEVVQETFLAVFSKPESFDFSAKFSTWLCAIAKNKAADVLRKQGRHWSKTVELDDTMIEVFPSDDIAVLDRLEEDERNDILGECIQRLPADQREAMLLVYHHGASMDVVAQLQNTPEGTVKTRLFHARKKVKDCVSKAYGLGVPHA